MQSHFLMNLIFTLYKMEVATNGANLNQEIANKLLVQNHPNYKTEDCYESLSILHSTFGGEFLSINKYYDLSSQNMLNGIKHLKYGIEKVDRDIKIEDSLQSKLMNYYIY